MGSEVRILVGAPVGAGELPPDRAAALLRDFLGRLRGAPEPLPARQRAVLAERRPGGRGRGLAAAAHRGARRALGRGAHRRPGRPDARRRARGRRVRVEPPVARALARRCAARAPPRRPARPAPGSRWRDLAVDDASIRRPPGVRFDTGGTGKGLAADLAAARLGGYARWAVDCGGDLRVGGAAPRAVRGRGRAPADRRARARPAPGHRRGRHVRAQRPHVAAPRRRGPRTTCSTRPPASRRGPASSARPRSRPRRSRPSRSPRPRCSRARPGARRWLARHGGLLVHDDGDVDLCGRCASAPSSG